MPERGHTMADGQQQRISVSEKNNAIIVQFRDSKILEDRTIQQLGTELIDLVQGRSAPRLVLDFTGVKYLSSAALGKLITLRRKVDQVGGKLKLCEIDTETMDVFRIAKLDDYFDIHRDQRSAIESLG
jgi:anti-sigma B factor antagonist